MGWDATRLLQPIAAEQPCGESLEDTPLLASFDTFRVFGQSISRDPTDDEVRRSGGMVKAVAWLKVRDTALDALGRSKDLRPLAHLAAALLRTDGFVAFLTTIDVASQWLDTHWGDVYPRIGEDPMFRRSALDCFADQMAVIEGVRRQPLVRSREHGAFSLRAVEMAAGQLQPGASDAVPTQVAVNAAFAAMPLDELRGFQQSVTRAVANLKAIESKMQVEAGTDAAPRFAGLSTQLARIDRVLQDQLKLRSDHVAPPEDDLAEGRSPSGPEPDLRLIRSREDAIRALDAVADFFRKAEPSSPVPLIVERAKRLIAKGFLEVLEDIAPQAVQQARAAGGLKDG